MKYVPSGGRWLMLLLALGGVASLRAQSPNDASFLSTVGELRDADYSAKAAIVERISASGHPSTRAVLTALMEDRLYFRNADQKVFIVKMADADPFNLIDPVTLKAAGTASADSVTAIGTNNSLRSLLRTEIAHFALSSPDASVRLDAVREMAQSLDEGNVATLRARLPVETNSSVKDAIATDLALASLDGADTDSKARLAAISTLSHSVSQDVRNRLALLTNKNPDGSFAENNEEVRKAAASAVSSIDGWRNFYAGIETLFLDLAWDRCSS